MDSINHTFKGNIAITYSSTGGKQESCSTSHGKHVQCSSGLAQSSGLPVVSELQEHIPYWINNLNLYPKRLT